MVNPVDFDFYLMGIFNIGRQGIVFSTTHCEIYFKTIHLFAFVGGEWAEVDFRSYVSALSLYVGLSARLHISMILLGH